MKRRYLQSGMRNLVPWMSVLALCLFAPAPAQSTQGERHDGCDQGAIGGPWSFSQRIPEVIVDEQGRGYLFFVGANEGDPSEPEPDEE